MTDTVEPQAGLTGYLADAAKIRDIEHDIDIREKAGEEQAAANLRAIRNTLVTAFECRWKREYSEAAQLLDLCPELLDA